MSGALYLVPTPIGNLGDISRRCAEALAAADFIAAEDTRVSLKLLNHLAIKKPLVSYHEHNKKESGPRIVERLLGGECCALVTDAGCPAISDPARIWSGSAPKQTFPCARFPAPAPPSRPCLSPPCPPDALSLKASCRHRKRSGARGWNVSGPRSGQ